MLNSYKYKPVFTDDYAMTVNIFDECGIIDKNYDIIVPIIYEYCYNFNKISIVKHNSQLYCINNTKQTTISDKFKYLNIFGYDIIFDFEISIAYRSNNYYMYDTYGNIIFKQHELKLKHFEYEIGFYDFIFNYYHYYNRIQKLKTLV